jgi:hypothetical protein
MALLALPYSASAQANDSTASKTFACALAL